jgi:hypothetical protein
LRKYCRVRVRVRVRVKVRVRVRVKSESRSEGVSRGFRERADCPHRIVG